MSAALWIFVCAGMFGLGMVIGSVTAIMEEWVFGSTWAISRIVGLVLMIMSAIAIVTFKCL